MLRIYVLGRHLPFFGQVFGPSCSEQIYSIWSLPYGEGGSICRKSIVNRHRASEVLAFTKILWEGNQPTFYLIFCAFFAFPDDCTTTTKESKSWIEFDRLLWNSAETNSSKTTLQVWTCTAQTHHRRWLGPAALAVLTDNIDVGNLLTQRCVPGE